ncbi:gustatory receptor for sugar taste 64e-like [Trichoplusia ni]|uniref:Gustatory receptor for sugar taste 64e-like n=1 Tax=Trichoplusia ni TaxID=7111 RepID=A0A7E5VEC9_TRINI|nr:gustatory receptor for sugar taste 64e-like [Trichoplusia ni]
MNLRVASACTMDLYSLDKFKTYKSDWNYPIHFRYQEHKSSAKKVKSPVTFQQAIKGTLIIGQCFGLIPILGIGGDDPSKLRQVLIKIYGKHLWNICFCCRFKYLSWHFAYTIVTIISQIVVTLLVLFSFFTYSKSPVETAIDLIFYSLGFTTTILFLRVAKHWPKLSAQISEIEAADPNADTKLKTKFNVCCIVVLFLAFLEHLFSEIYTSSIAIDCEPDGPFYETSRKHRFTWLFSFFPYNNFIGVLMHFINIQCTFNWNYSDLFVICMSIYVTSRLEQVNQRVLAAKDKNSPCSFWRTIREDYNRSVHLVRQVDDVIGGIVFTSFASNLFFICSQLLHTFSGGISATPRCRPHPAADYRLFRGYENSIYFAYSFIFLVARALAVSLTAAKVHSASLEPAYSLYDVSSATFCVEIERFLDQIHGDTVALSGLQFFNVKRGLVLTIAGTIVTYELVLLQFAGVSPVTPEPIENNIV